MKNTWWANIDELDPDQQSFLDLPAAGKFVIYGPPGSGKTNLLLLRAKYLYGKDNFKNILFITYTKCLADFIRSGLGDHKFFDPDQVQTFWSWARSHIHAHYSQGIDEFKSLLEVDENIPKKDKLNDKKKKDAALTRLLQVASKKAPATELYDAIFIDEAQDLSKDHIKELSKLSKVITIAGDNRQGIYEQDGLSISGFTPINLTYHYRIGDAICKVADKIIPPKKGFPPLTDFRQYPEEKNKSDANIFEYQSREAQYTAIIERLRGQLRAFPDEMLGVIAPTRKILGEFKNAIQKTDLARLVSFHTEDGSENSFKAEKPIHVLTIHGSKGAEFRAVHIAGGEEIKFPMGIKREIPYTAVTRAKTSLSLHFTGKIMPYIDSAFPPESRSGPAREITKKDLF